MAMDGWQDGVGYMDGDGWNLKGVSVKIVDPQDDDDDEIEIS